MTSCKIAHNFQAETPELPAGITRAADAGFSWIADHFSNTTGAFSHIAVKDLTNLTLAHFYWNYPQIGFLYLQTLLLKQEENGSFGDLRETARAVSCLSNAYSYLESNSHGLDNSDLLTARGKAVHYLLEHRARWGENLYDTVYILPALADAGIFEEELCLDLCKNDNSDRQHPGTTALILTALQKQKNLGKFNEAADFMIFEFISQKLKWLSSVREDGFWKYSATSNLILQTFVFCNQKYIAMESLPWLSDSQKENGSWENDLNTTSLSLLTL
ncbi:hypothetical protein [Methanimicrococcus blatticola]|uniref:Prenyltransferase/squalene oxidase-like repeat protein n=1 Tax=Methanimicrococcus blatticola TaxID=91560 RepID=A0A484F5S1_9EURY|nr:hypothetical protein [Methanimicrococcus blatticola]MBZ3936175.1 hypothetical protein [Methanimicrococcus blatticola]MCC2508418.1 hypothetical protein [Methanimicrococcus blatticola]TDQ70129.1 hypothetical protein C7391_0468 [Methanimicrococcus blatticola]